MDTTHPLFLIHIADGYSFRNTIGIIKSETDYATMVLSPTKIEISFMNASKCAVHKITLQTPEFTMYRYNIRDHNGELCEEYPIAFETSEMSNTTKGIGRRDGIRLYWMPGENKINVQPIKTTTKDPGRAGALFVRILTIEHIKFNTGEYKGEPNVRVQAKDFADLCSQANTLKCANLQIVGHNNAVVFMGILPNQTTASINKFVSQIEVPKTVKPAANMEEIDALLGQLRVTDTPVAAATTTGLSLNIVKTEDLMTVTVPITTVKALSKIHNISPSGTQLRFHFAEGRPTKLSSPIGTYGVYDIYLRNPRT